MAEQQGREPAFCPFPAYERNPATFPTVDDGVIGDTWTAFLIDELMAKQQPLPEADLVKPWGRIDSSLLHVLNHPPYNMIMPAYGTMANLSNESIFKALAKFDLESQTTKANQDGCLLMNVTPRRSTTDVKPYQGGVNLFTNGLKLTLTHH